MLNEFDVDRLLADLEHQADRNLRESRALLKSLDYRGNTRRRDPDFGRPVARPTQIDLVKAEMALNSLIRTNQLTDEQANKARARLMALRETKTIPLR